MYIIWGEFVKNEDTLYHAKHQNLGGTRVTFGEGGTNVVGHLPKKWSYDPNI